MIAHLVFAPLRIDACFNWTTCTDAKVARKIVLYDPDGSVRADGFATLRPACPVRLPQENGPCDLASYVVGSNGALFSPQGGMRISARDLARIGQVFIKPGSFLMPASLAEMTRPVWVFDGGNGDTEGGFYCSYGLAVQILATPNLAECHDDLFGDGVRRIGHAGEAYGLRSGLWVDVQRRQGVAFYATGIPDDAPKGTSAFTSVEEALASPRR